MTCENQLTAAFAVCLLGLPTGLPAASIWHMTQVEDEIVVATHGRGIWSVNIPGLAGGQIFKPLLGSLTQGPDGFLSARITLRAQYDSTIVAVNDTPFVKLGPNPVAMRDTVVKYPVTAARTVNVSVTSYKNNVAYPAISRSIALTLIAPPRAGYTNTLNTTTTDFTGSGFSIQTPGGFTNGAIHSAHPYTNNLNNTYLLTIPITVAATNAYLAYDDIAIVEPGEPGAPFGDPSFYDYVVVEGSRDGLTWLPLADGYDARYDSVWLTTYNASGSGSSSMYRHHEVNLRQRFSAGEIIFVRFRLYTDPNVTGWGWAVDNLEIQQRITSVDGEIGAPTRFTLAQNYPNPFNPTTTIGYQLPAKAHALLKVFNSLGQEVATLVNEVQSQGTYNIKWNAQGMASGVYFYRLEAGEFTSTRKLLLLK